MTMSDHLHTHPHSHMLRLVAVVLAAVVVVLQPVVVVSAASAGLWCTLQPIVTSGGSLLPNSSVTADTPSIDGTRLFEVETNFTIQFVVNVTQADSLTYTVSDYLDKVKLSESFNIASGLKTYNLTCGGTLPGYFAISATVNGVNVSLPSAGTRPLGIATFGLLANVTDTLPPVTYKYQDLHRFGMQGLGQNLPYYTKLGVTGEFEWRQLWITEPTKPNTFVPALLSGSFYQSGTVMRIIRLEGVSAWLSPNDTNCGVTSDHPYTTSCAPTNFTYFEQYAARVGNDTEMNRAKYYPNQKKNYYQVQWEPTWVDTPQNLTAMYAALWRGVHSTDPNAVVMGPTSPDPYLTTAWIKKYAPYGVLNYTDAVATHGYSSNTMGPMSAPEASWQYTPTLSSQMRTLRSTMQQWKANMSLLCTERGISYDTGIKYGPLEPSANQLYAQAVISARAHIIILGEGAQWSYFFYGTDYYKEVGFGSFFDLVHADGASDNKLSVNSPKPLALVFATLTRILDGTATLGYFTTLPTQVYGYAFQQLNGGKVITALWTHNATHWPIVATGIYDQVYNVSYSLRVDAVGTSGSVTVFDVMAGVSTVPYVSGVASLILTESPIFIVSTNAAIVQSQLTAPLGYAQVVPNV